MQIAPLIRASLIALFLPLLLVKGDASSELKAVQQAFFSWHEQQAPEFSTDVGTTAYNDRLANLSTAVFHTQYVAVQGFFNRTSSIDRSQLSRQHQYSYDIFMDTLRTFLNGYLWRQFGALNPINFLEGFYLDLGYIIDITPFDTKGDFENYIARLEARPAQIQQMMDRMSESVRLGTTYHLVSVKPVPGQISAVIETPPIQSLLYKPFNDTLDQLELSQEEKDDMRSRAVQGLQGVWTVLGRLKTFITDQYSHHTRGTFGAGGLPSGGNYYRACLAWHLSLDMPPTQVHLTGLKEVDRITQLMQQVMARQGFSGTVAEFYNHLKEDPQFHKNSADELLRDYENLIFNRIYPKLPQLFKDVPPNKVV